MSDMATGGSVDDAVAIVDLFQDAEVFASGRCQADHEQTSVDDAIAELYPQTESFGPDGSQNEEQHQKIAQLQEHEQQFSPNQTFGAAGFRTDCAAAGRTVDLFSSSSDEDEEPLSPIAQLREQQQQVSPNQNFGAAALRTENAELHQQKPFSPIAQ